MIFYGDVAHEPGIIPLNLGGDLVRQSGFCIRNMNFLKFVIARELHVLIITTCNRYQMIPKSIILQMNWRSRFLIWILDPKHGFL